MIDSVEVIEAELSSTCEVKTSYCLFFHVGGFGAARRGAEQRCSHSANYSRYSPEHFNIHKQ